MKKNQRTMEVLENANIIYTDGKGDYFQAISFTDDGVNIGRIVNNEVFIIGGFIPKQNIKKIISGTERKICKKKLKY